MALNHIGLHFPGNSAEAKFVDSTVSGETEYSVYQDCDGDYVVGMCHEDVGLTDWYWATQEDVDKILYGG